MTGRIEKTVFISYRRDNLPWALAIFQNLKNEGYDVFFDYLSINSGDFEQIIIANIKARANFIVVLTPSALERCNEPGDWLRREIETAMDEKRNIVPLMLESFDFGSSSTTKALTGKLEKLKKYNGLRIHSDYFFEGMSRLREQFLNISLDAVVHPIPENAKSITGEHQIAASKAPPVTKVELTAQEIFERGVKSLLEGQLDEANKYFTEAIFVNPHAAHIYVNRGVTLADKGDFDGAIADYDKAIDIEPDLPFAYINRGTAWREKGDKENAISDFSEGIRLNPNIADSYFYRGVLQSDNGELDGAIEDFTQAIRLQPDLGNAYFNRGNLYREKGQLNFAIQDYDKAIELGSTDAEAYHNRGDIRRELGDLDGAIQDYDKAIQIKPDYVDAFNHRGVSRCENGDIKGGVEDFDKALNYDPNHLNVLFNRGSAYWNLGDFENALRDYQGALQLQPDKLSLRLLVFSVLRKLGNEVEANEQKKLISKEIVNETEYNQACFEAICGNLDKSLDLLKIGLEKEQSTKERARQDRDFENIRDDPRFIELVSE